MCSQPTRILTIPPDSRFDRLNIQPTRHELFRHEIAGFIPMRVQGQHAFESMNLKVYIALSYFDALLGHPYILMRHPWAWWMEFCFMTVYPNSSNKICILEVSCASHTRINMSSDSPSLHACVKTPNSTARNKKAHAHLGHGAVLGPDLVPQIFSIIEVVFDV